MHEPGTQWQQWRLYHHAHYASKLRGRDIMAAGSTKDLQRLVRASGRKFDHINTAQLLLQLQHMAKAGQREEGGPHPMDVIAPSDQAKAVDQLVARAVGMAKKNLKWFEPRNAASVVNLTAQLRHKDAALLDGLMACTVARMDEAYSRDLVAMLQGLRTHGHAPSAELLEGAERFMLAKLPTGRMAPENVASLARLLHGASGAGLAAPLVGALAQDLALRLDVYSPQALAGLVSTLASAGAPPALAAEVLPRAMQHMRTHAAEHASAAAVLTFLSGAARLAAQAEGGVQAWSGGHHDTIHDLYSTLTKDPRALDIERLPALVKALTMLGRAGGPVPPPAFMAALHSALQTYKELILRMRPLQDALREMYAALDGNSKAPAFLRASAEPTPSAS